MDAAHCSLTEDQFDLLEPIPAPAHGAEDGYNMDNDTQCMHSRPDTLPTDLGPLHLWTMLDCGTIVQGVHYVNRFGYLATRKPAPCEGCEVLPNPTDSDQLRDYPAVDTVQDGRDALPFMTEIELRTVLVGFGVKWDGDLEAMERAEALRYLRTLMAVALASYSDGEDDPATRSLPLTYIVANWKRAPKSAPRNDAETAQMVLAGMMRAAVHGANSDPLTASAHLARNAHGGLLACIGELANGNGTAMSAAEFLATLLVHAREYGRQEIYADLDHETERGADAMRAALVAFARARVDAGAFTHSAGDALDAAHAPDAGSWWMISGAHLTTRGAKSDARTVGMPHGVLYGRCGLIVSVDTRGQWDADLYSDAAEMETAWRRIADAANHPALAHDAEFIAAGRNMDARGIWVAVNEGAGEYRITLDELSENREWTPERAADIRALAQGETDDADGDGCTYRMLGVHVEAAKGGAL